MKNLRTTTNYRNIRVYLELIDYEKVRTRDCLTAWWRGIWADRTGILNFIFGLKADKTCRSSQMRADSILVWVLLRSALTDRSELSAHNICLNKKIPVLSAQILRIKKQSFDLAYGPSLNSLYIQTPVSAPRAPCQGMSISVEWTGINIISASVSQCNSVWGK